jgi:hypothetical protein
LIIYLSIIISFILLYRCYIPIVMTKHVKNARKKQPHLVYIRNLSAQDNKMLDSLKGRPGYNKSNSKNLLKAGYDLLTIEEEKNSQLNRVKKENQELSARVMQLERKISMHESEVDTIRTSVETILVDAAAISDRIREVKKQNAPFFKRKYNSK